ncbi:MAG TPA: zinc finger MYND domain-containing protein, partial [Candidatus Babeliales bacterium]|nr:zinc finger MYND domain-containing protein [Candidatus Babeliales bacterium]
MNLKIKKYILLSVLLCSAFSGMYAADDKGCGSSEEKSASVKDKVLEAMRRHWFLSGIAAACTADRIAAFAFPAQRHEIYRLGAESVGAALNFVSGLLPNVQDAVDASAEVNVVGNVSNLENGQGLSAAASSHQDGADSSGNDSGAGVGIFLDKAPSSNVRSFLELNQELLQNPDIQEILKDPSNVENFSKLFADPEFVNGLSDIEKQSKEFENLIKTICQNQESCRKVECELLNQSSNGELGELFKLFCIEARGNNLNPEDENKKNNFFFRCADSKFDGLSRMIQAIKQVLTSDEFGASGSNAVAVANQHDTRGSKASINNDESNRCAICNRAASKKCSVCKKIYYCGATHQNQHWSNHKLTCNKECKVAENVAVETVAINPVSAISVQGESSTSGNLLYHDDVSKNKVTTESIELISPRRECLDQKDVAVAHDVV